MIADFEMLDVYGVIMFVDDAIHNVFVGPATSSNRLRYNKETGAFELLNMSDVRGVFIRTTACSLDLGAGVSLEEFPSVADITCRAVPAE